MLEETFNGFINHTRATDVPKWFPFIVFTFVWTLHLVYLVYKMFLWRFRRRVKRYHLLLLALLSLTATIVIMKDRNTEYTIRLSEKQHLPMATPSHIMNLSYHGPDLKPRSKLIKAYHDILDSNLGGRVPVYIEPDVLPYEERWRKAKDACNRLPNSDKGIYSTRRSLWHLKEKNMVYCSVAKVGSSFWRRVWRTISDTNEAFKSPYQFSYEDFDPRGHSIQNSSMENTLKNSLRYIFTRNPYSRVFSAYVDKLLSPNTYMWRLGGKIIGRFRQGASEKSKSCGHDVSFGEFVKYIISTSVRNFDCHFIPVSEVCDVCSLRYDVIGKMETFKEDSLYLLNKVGALGKDVVFKQFETEYTVDNVVDLVTRTYLQRDKLEQCMSFHVALRRQWRQFQISGTIPLEEHYPFTLEQSDTVGEVEMINIILKAYQKRTHTSRNHKKEAFLQAYQQVTTDDLEQLRKQYAKDFDLFDYDDKPKTLFDKSHQKVIPFDYFDVMKE